jgi:hypothetical protein
VRLTAYNPLAIPETHGNVLQVCARVVAYILAYTQRTFLARMHAPCALTPALTLQNSRTITKRGHLLCTYVPGAHKHGSTRGHPSSPRTLTTAANSAAIAVRILLMASNKSTKRAFASRPEHSNCRPPQSRYSTRFARYKGVASRRRCEPATVELGRSHSTRDHVLESKSCAWLALMLARS